MHNKVVQPDAVRGLLDLPENMTPELMVSLGYPRSIPKPPSRRTVDDTVVRWIKEETTKAEEDKR